MMHKYAGITVILSCFLTACIKPQDAPPPPPVLKKQKQIRITQHFSDLAIEGAINVVLLPKARGGKVEVQGDSRDLAYVFTKLDKHQLTLEVAPNYPKHGPLTAYVANSQLKHLAFHGKGNIVGKHRHGSLKSIVVETDGKVSLSGKSSLEKVVVSGTTKAVIEKLASKRLEVLMNGNADVQMRGFANLEFLKYGGEGQLSLYWVDSQDLTVEGYGAAKVSLAGFTHYLHAETHQRAQLDGRYLRVTKAYVKAHDHSLIRVQPIEGLNAFATDNGNIYYYSSPRYRVDHMAQNGAVLNYSRYW